MKEFFVGLVVFVGVVLMVMFLSTIGGFYQFAMFSYFAPKVTAVQNQVFHESQQYNDGMASDLGDLMLQYKGAKTQEQKDAIRAVILQRYGRYDKSRLPSDLQEFYNSL